MSRSAADFASAVAGLVKDDGSFLTPAGVGVDGDIATAVTRALGVLSLRSPAQLAQEYAGNGSTFLFSAPTLWIPTQSAILNVYCPWEQNEQDQSTDYGPGSVEVFELSAGTLALRTLTFTASAGNTIRVMYTGTHTPRVPLVPGPDTPSTIKTLSDEDSVIFLAASECLRIMASKANALASAALGSSFTDSVARGDTYIRLADYYEERSGLKPYLRRKEGGSTFSQFPRFTSITRARGRTRPLTH